ncbi:MAG: NAD(P)H-dependent glycerol-3-phosphate dehydrogenase [Gammaproteobacteria bacterium]
MTSSGTSSGPDNSDIAVFGAGSWGTALAVQFARAGHRVTLWGRGADELQKMDEQRCNQRYLPGIAFPEGLHPDPDLRAVVRRHQDLLICVPSHGFREILTAIRPHLQDGARIAWATKGFEHDSGCLPHEVVREVLGTAVPVAVLSGPTFASEVGAGLPTAMTIAARPPAFAAELAIRMSGLNFRAYTSDDMVGVEVGGAVKNVLAIGAGISDGLGFGANTRIALITRGLLEMTRLGTALGAQPATFMGLSGMGDLVLSCTDDQSRNRRLGLMVAAGKTPAEAAEAIGQVVEGTFAAVSVRTVASRLGLEMPICEQVWQVLHNKQRPKDAVMALMARSLKPETDIELRSLFGRGAGTLPID